MELFQLCIDNNTSDKWDKIASFFIKDWRKKLSGSTEQCARLLIACPILCQLVYTVDDALLQKFDSAHLWESLI